MSFSIKGRILLVSSWAPPMVGGPQNLYNLFSRFSPDSYCILTTSEVIRQRDATGTWLQGEYIFCDHAGPVEKSAPVRPTVGRRPITRASHSLLNLTRRMPYLAAYFVENTLSSLYSLVTIARMVRSGIRIVREKRIRCIMGISDIGPALIATYVISRLTRVPHAPYLFDVYLGNSMPPINVLLARIFEPRIFKTSAVVILTNECTERFYRKRYGDSFRCVVIHNSIVPSEYESRRSPYNPTRPYVIVFTGNVSWPQERSVMNLVRTMDELRDLPVRLDLYVPNAPERLKESITGRTNIHLASAAQSDMPAIQCSATILFLPLSWHTKSPDIIATATPGKLADYLAAGRPMLIHAPPYAYVNRYAKESNFALVVDEENTTRLQAAIKKLLFDVEYSRELIANAIRNANRKHDANLNAEELARILDSIAA